jgi:hypothetical protein
MVMESKIAYILKETGQTRRSNWGVIIHDGTIIAYPPSTFVREIRNLKNQGYEIIKKDVPFSELMPGYDSNKYRELNSEEKERLEKILES